VETPASTDGLTPAKTTTVLQLVDFNNGGDSVAAVNDWQVKQSITLSTGDTGWHRLSISYDPATGSVVAVYDSQTFTLGAAGDFNGDGKVDAADYVVWRSSINTQAAYDTWRANFGASGGGLPTGLVGNFYVGYRESLPGDNGVGRPPTFDMIGAGVGSTSVPEPGSLGLVLVGAVGWVARRRRLS
jgi:hypothetical protein